MLNRSTKNVFTLTSILLRMLMRRPRVKSGIVPKNALIVQPAKLGDMICTTPVFRALKKSFPACKLTVAGNRINKDVLENNLDIDSYIVLESDFKKNIKNFKNGDFDFAAITSPNFLLLAALMNSDIPTIAAPKIINGRSPYATKSYKILSRFVIQVPHSFGSYAPREYLRLLEPLNIHSEDTKKYVYWGKNAEEKIINLISKIPRAYNYLVGISAGAGNKEKQWDPKKFAAVADYLIKNRKAHIILIGGRTDVAENNEMLGAIVNKKQVIDTTNKLSIDELKSLIGKVSLFISVNSGPMYIAEALDVPTVDLVGPVSELDQPPKGEIHKIVIPYGRLKPIIFVMDTRGHDIEEARRIARSTRFEDVISAADEALKIVNKRRGLQSNFLR